MVVSLTHRRVRKRQWRTEPQKLPHDLFGRRMTRFAFIKDDDNGEARSSGRPNNHSFHAWESATMDSSTDAPRDLSALPEFRQVMWHATTWLCEIWHKEVLMPTARTPPPPLPAFVGHFSFFKKTVASAPWWGQHIYTNPHGWASGRGQITKPLNFNDWSKKYSRSFQWFFSLLKHYAAFNYNCNALQNRFLKRGVLMVSIFVLYTL